MADNVFIVLATHNGAQYLQPQLDSLYRQTQPDLTILILDDHSSDDSPAIIRQQAQLHPSIRIVPRRANAPSSAQASYGQLLEEARQSGADYVFCCDQDDVWEPSKIEHMLDRLKVVEGEAGAPALVHHDLAVVDGRLEPVAGSFWTLMGLEPGGAANPQRLLSRNEVTGCALACNRALLDMALPIPEPAIMHDWWLALCAAYFGRLQPMPERLVRYRQHGANVIGAKSYWHGLNPFTNWVAGWRRGNDEFLATTAQAAAFQDAMAARLDASAETAVALDLYRQLPALPRSLRLRALHRAGVWRKRWLLDTVLALRMLLLSRRDS